MASLRTRNPHSLNVVTASDSDLPILSGCDASRDIESGWISCRGQAIADDVKLFMAVSLNERKFVLADARLLQLNSDVTVSPGHVALELFFDGELRDLGTHERTQFIVSLQSSLSLGISEALRRRVRSLLSSNPSAVKTLTRPDDRICPLPDPFRDAGCVLTFIAVRFSLPLDAAAALGEVCFPEQFGVADQETGKSPGWLIGFGVFTGLLGATVIAVWSSIAYNYLAS
jgi:hypothetical protein